MNRFFLALFFIGVLGCRQPWNEKNKSAFVSGCLKGAEADMGEKKAKKYCSCMLRKVMKKYPDAGDAHYLRYDTSMRQTGLDCLNSLSSDSLKLP